MAIPSRGLIIVVCLTAAIISYLVGFSFGVGLFIFLGVLLELAFWFNLLKWK